MVVKLSWFDQVILSPSCETVDWLLNPWVESVCLGGMASWGKSFVWKPSNSSSSHDAECYFAAVICFSTVFMAVPRRQQSLWQKGDKGLKINFKDVLSVHVPLVEHVNLSALFSSSDFTPGDVSWDFNCFSVAPWWRESRVYPGIS